MRVQMVTTAAGPDGIYRVGETWDVAPAVADSLLSGGYAVALDPVHRETATAPPPATPMVAGAEVAVTRKRRTA